MAFDRNPQTAVAPRGPQGGAPAGLIRRLSVQAAAWTVVAIVFAAQGWWAARASGQPQPWWPSLGYAVAIFSIWFLLTEPLAISIRHVANAQLPPGVKLGLCVAGFPLATATHTGLFAAVYWWIYNDGGRISTVWDMAMLMLVPNIHTNLLFYAAIVVWAVIPVIKTRPVGQADTAARGSPPRPLLRIRSRGVVRDVALDDIDWIGVAGHYAEVHTKTGVSLLDESLASLALRLPSDRFARIHRGTIIQLARIREVRAQGRGDALVRLMDNTELRLSRRYRAALAPWFQQA